MIYYHVTPHTRTPKILRQGLTFGHKRQWNNNLGGKLGQTKKIYLFSSLDAAIQMAARLEWGLITQHGKNKNTQVDILEIHAEPPVEADPNLEAQMNSGTWWTTDQEIPPDAIKKVIPLTLAMKQDFIARRNAGLIRA